MSNFKNLVKHLQTVHIHRKYVRKACFKAGLYWQGLTHDLSKYSLTELSIAKYYTGKKSPHQVCREQLGYSPSWTHHYHINKHHFQFFWDESEIGEIIPIKMPYKYVVESVCDMLGASKAYNKDNWQPEMLWNYWETKCKGKRIMHEDSAFFTEFMLWNLYQMCEEVFFVWYKANKKWLERIYTEKSAGELQAILDLSACSLN